MRLLAVRMAVVATDCKRCIVEWSGDDKEAKLAIGGTERTRSASECLLHSQLPHHDWQAAIRSVAREFVCSAATTAAAASVVLFKGQHTKKGRQMSTNPGTDINEAQREENARETLRTQRVYRVLICR